MRSGGPNWLESRTKRLIDACAVRARGRAAEGRLFAVSHGVAMSILHANPSRAATITTDGPQSDRQRVRRIPRGTSGSNRKRQANHVSEFS